MFLINFNQWKCACVGIDNRVILLRARYKRNHDSCILFVYIKLGMLCRGQRRALQFMLKAASYEDLVEGLSVFFD